MIIDLLTENEKKLIKVISYKEGETLFYENDTCSIIGVVLEGEVNISSSTFEGNEIIYNHLNKGAMFGNNLIFASDNKFRGDVKSVTNGKIATINKETLLKILMSNEAFLKEYLSINSEFTKSLNTKIKLLSFTNAEERFLYYLFVNDSKIKFKNVTTLAQSLYLSREATSRLISKLEKNGRITRKNHVISLIS